MTTKTKQDLIDSTRNDIGHNCDGPITRHVLICRAMARVHDVGSSVATEALYEELIRFGFMDPDEAD